MHNKVGILLDGNGQQELEKKKKSIGSPPPEVQDPNKVSLDWYTARIYKLVYDLMNLAPQGKLAAAKLLEKEFMDPVELDIFTEEEASYNAMLLRKKDEHNEEPYDEVILSELFKKSKKTIESLSEYLLLSKQD